MTTKQVRVSPNQGDRKVYSAWASRAQGVYNTKAEAVSLAKSVAQNKWAEMIVQNENGKIGFRNSYGKDLFPPRW